jgi:hypothetical protein
MKMKYHKIFHPICVFFLLFLAACSDDTKMEGPTGGILKNDCIKRSLGPGVAGLDMEFAYAMAVTDQADKIVSASVEASIAGAAETWLEHRSYNPNGFVAVGSQAVNTGAKTTVDFIVDTCAATLRYYYRIPDAAKGKQVSFTFSAKAGNGETVSHQMGPYTIANMDIKHDLHLDATSCYISLADMAVYNATEAAADPSKIDLIYLYRNYPAWGVNFGHAFVSPAADPAYLPAANAQYRPDGFILPVGVSNSSPVRKTNELRDRQLYDIPGQPATSQYGIYVDDVDIKTLNFTGMPDYAIDMRAESGLWAETQDKKYRAFIYVNSTTSPSNSSIGSAVISLKRLTMN